MLLQNDNARALIDPLQGGRLASLAVNGVELLVSESGGPMQWGCYPMAPWAGRVRKGQFEWENTPYTLSTNAPPHALHGTVFSEAWDVIEPGHLRCKLGSNWPWTGEVRSYIELNTGELFWRLEVHAEAAVFPVVLGWHPWFRRNLENTGPATLKFEPKTMYVRGDDHIPTGERSVPTPGPWDDCFTHVVYSPILSWPNGLHVEVSSTCNHWVVYDEPEHAICVEPQSGPPDAFNLGGFETARPNQPVCHTMRIRWWNG